MLDLRDCRTVLIVKPSALGDIVHATPCLRRLRHALPQARILMVVEPQFAAVVRHNPHVDALIEHRLGAPRALPFRVWGAWRVLRPHRIDLAIDLSGSRKCIAWMLGSRARITAGRGRRYVRWRLPYTPTPGLHAVEVCQDVLDQIGLPAPPCDPEIYTSAEDDDRLLALLERLDAPARDFVVVNPFTRHAWKDWPLDRFAALVERLRGLPIVISGGPGEEQRAEELLRLAPAGAAVSLAGRLSLGEALCLYRRARLVVSGDTGPLHAAAALGTATVALFGSTLPERTRPWGAGHIVVQKSRPDVYPTPRSSRDDRHMRAIDVDAVHEAVMIQLARPRPQAGGD